MRNSLILLFLCISITISATTYYIDPSGSNSNNGSSGSPWKTLAYACSKATASGDIVHVNTGTYIETTQIFLPTGVSIEGDGANSIIQSRVTASFLLMLHSGSENTNGNQHISNVTFDGVATTAFGGVSIFNRGNVIVHHCIFRDFLDSGIQFNDGSGRYAPVTMAVGNQFYNNRITNCSRSTGSGETSYGRGGLTVGGQQGMLIHDNYLTQLGRGSNLNGYVIKYGGWGWNRGMKIYNNTIIKSVNDGGVFEFAVELMHEEGLEFYNNIVEGALDVNFISRGAYAYGLYVHNNTFGPSALSSSGGNAIILEFDVANAIIVNNYIKNVGCPFHFSTRAGYNLSNNTFAYNICQNIGLIGSTAARAIRFIEVDTKASSSNGFYIYNNVFQSTTTAGAIGAWGIIMPTLTNGNTNNIVRNNIITGFTSGGIVANVATYINGLVISNNILYGNGNGNDPYYIGGTPSGYTISNQLKTNPLFVSSSDFHLQSSSPAVSAGIKVGLSTDYEGKSLNVIPSIGAFEYNSTLPSPAVPIYQSSVVENATPSLLKMTYSLTLANIIPSTSSFKVLVNTVSRPVSLAVISGNTVQLTLSSAIKYGDIVNVSYTKPETNPIQTTTSGVAVGFSTRTIINNLTSPTKVVLPVTIKMTISPAYAHKTINVLLEYSGALSSQTVAAISPQIIRISDLTGKLFIEKLLVTGATDLKMPLNLSSGIYTVKMLAGGQELSSQKIIVY